jgi:hypothetical protein
MRSHCDGHGRRLRARSQGRGRNATAQALFELLDDLYGSCKLALQCLNIPADGVDISSTTALYDKGIDQRPGGQNERYIFHG